MSPAGTSALRSGASSFHWDCGRPFRARSSALRPNRPCGCTDDSPESPPDRAAPRRPRPTPRSVRRAMSRAGRSAYIPVRGTPLRAPHVGPRSELTADEPAIHRRNDRGGDTPLRGRFALTEAQVELRPAGCATRQTQQSSKIGDANRHGSLRTSARQPDATEQPCDRCNVWLKYCLSPRLLHIRRSSESF